MMKKLMTLALILTLGMGLTSARGKKTENVKTTTFVADIHCENCSTKVMNNVPALGKGIKDVAVDLTQKTITVTYDAEKNNDVNIINGFRSLSINAQAAAQACKTAKDGCCAATKECGSAKRECGKEATKDGCCAAKKECAGKESKAESKHGCCNDAAKKNCCKDK